jgi:hypothetical protein
MQRMRQVPDKIIRIQKIHLHPSELGTIKAPAIGPIIGPINTAAAKLATAGPLPTASHISAKAPPPIARGAEANNPPKNLVTRMVARFLPSD